jgi:hypothetical protein
MIALFIITINWKQPKCPNFRRLSEYNLEHLSYREKGKHQLKLQRISEISKNSHWVIFRISSMWKKKQGAQRWQSVYYIWCNKKEI